jgi:predicted acylesterase/phospholipase RssA
MTQRGLFLRFWLFLAVSIGAGLLALSLLMRLGGVDGSTSGLAWSVAMTIPRVLFVIFALLIAILFGSLVWNSLYWLTGAAGFRSEPLVLHAVPLQNTTTLPARANRAPGKKLAEFRNPDGEPEFRIGIILAGGGAKGVYQAGALQAIWEFLEREGALDCVRMIAGTSIGSWNSMFWLTGQVAARNGKRAPIHEWWTSARLSSVVNPSWYVPVLRNYLGGNDVWRLQFRAQFKERPAAFPYYYLTRSNVGKATLEFSTNRVAPRNAAGELASYRNLPNSYRSRSPEPSLQEIESAVFASMDIPPAFKRLRDNSGNEFEDGGVIDNLPIQFATWSEGCNLLFVLPLNATFEARLSNVSILARMARVLDVRQGVLERDSLKDISLYNRLIEAERASQRKLKDVHKYTTTTFCICPAPKLAVGTFGFSSLKRHGDECYDLMYEATRDELETFDFSPANTDVWMAKVNPDRTVDYEDFTIH